MDTMQAFMMGQASIGKEPKVFDWDKAAQIIKEKGVASAEAGLQEDWGYTSDLIFIDGKPVTSGYTYLSSTWATPVLRIDGEEDIECFVMQSEKPEWNESTKWPDSAVNIINS